LFYIIDYTVYIVKFEIEHEMRDSPKTVVNKFGLFMSDTKTIINKPDLFMMVSIADLFTIV
jgi:hypothetical protein